MSKNRFFVLSLMIVIGTFLFASNALALTPAGTEITNQAAATFTDEEGNPYTANSNQVITVVLPVYGLTITPNQTSFVGDAGFVPAMEQNAAPGATVYYQYILTNTGNDVDTYTLAIYDSAGTFDPTGTAEIYLDANDNGFVDPGEEAISTLANVEPDEQVSLIVVYDVPLQPTVGPGDNALVNITGSSTHDATPTVAEGTLDQNNTHRTTVVDNAIIVAHKEVNVDEASAGDTLTYRIIASNTGNRPTTLDTLNIGGTDYYGTIIADPLPTHPDTDVPFEITDSTTVEGTPVDGMPIYWVGDTTPAADTSDFDGTTYAGGTWYLSYDAAKDAEAPGSDEYIRAVGYITGNTPIEPGQSFDLEFDVRIPIDHPAGDILNTGRVEYDDADSVEQYVVTNTTVTTIGGPGYESVAIMIGPDGEANDHDQLNTGYNLANEDTTDIATIAAGEIRNITLTVYNPGNAPDVINILPPTPPAGWTVGLYNLDGVTPLGNTNADAYLDVGELDPGETKSFIVRVFVPSDAPNGADSTIIVYAQSSNAPTVILPSDSTSYSNIDAGATVDTITVISSAPFSVGDYINIGGVVKPINAILSGTQIVVPHMAPAPAGSGVITGPIGGYNATVILFEAITGAAIDYHNNDPANSDSTSFTIDPSDTTYIDMPLELCNPAVEYDVYTLTENLPAEWRVFYYSDANCDTIINPSELLPITSIGVDGGNSCECLVARVFFPADIDSSLDHYTVTFYATSTNDTTVKDTVRNGIYMRQVCDLLLQPDRSSTGVPGFTVNYLHNLMNIGNTIIPATTTTFTVNSPHNWTYVLYQEDPDSAEVWDVMNYVGGVFQLTHAVGVNATNDSISRIKVKVYIPSNAPDQTVEAAVITVTHGGCDGTASDYVTDVTEVILSNLLITKKVINLTDRRLNGTLPADTLYANAVNFNEGYPGDTLIYYVNFRNIGTDSLGNVVVYDPIPENTEFVVGSAFGYPTVTGATYTIAYSDDDGATWGYVPSANPQGIDPDVTNIRWTYTNANYNDSLLSGQQGRARFWVVIK